MKDKAAFAEVIESSLQGWTAQSWQWDQFPSFGSLVVVHSGPRTIFGIIYEVETGSSDSTRQPFAYGKTEQELRAQQPQIFEFLRTSFGCLTVGYSEQGKIFYTLAPAPAKIHAFVERPELEQARRFFSNDSYMHLLFNVAAQRCNVDELLLALVTHRGAIGALSQDTFARFIRMYITLTSNDYQRVRLFLRRAELVV